MLLFSTIIWSNLALLDLGQTKKNIGTKVISHQRGSQGQARRRRGQTMARGGSSPAQAWGARWRRSGGRVHTNMGRETRWQRILGGMVAAEENERRCG